MFVINQIINKEQDNQQHLVMLRLWLYSSTATFKTELK